MQFLGIGRRVILKVTVKYSMHAYSQLMNQLCTITPFACNVSVPGFSFRCFCTSARAAACAESSLDSDVLSSSRMGAIEKNGTIDMNIRCPVLVFYS